MRFKHSYNCDKKVSVWGRKKRRHWKVVSRQALIRMLRKAEVTFSHKGGVIEYNSRDEKIIMDIIDYVALTSELAVVRFRGRSEN